MHFCIFAVRPGPRSLASLATTLAPLRTAPFRMVRWTAAGNSCIAASTSESPSILSSVATDVLPRKARADLLERELPPSQFGQPSHAVGHRRRPSHGTLIL